MMHQRPVDFKTKIALAKQRAPFSILGILFTIIGVGGLLPVYLLTSTITEDLPEVNYAEVMEFGVPTTGTIEDIEIKYNTQINGQHPANLSYSYDLGNGKVNSKVQVMAPHKVAILKIGDQVDLKVHNEQSIIIGYQPYQFPAFIFLLIPGIFGIIGIVFLTIIWLGVSREVKLYQEGLVKEGIILAMVPVNGIGKSSNDTRISVHYSYENSHGEKVVTHYNTRDFSIINDKRKGDPVKLLISPTNERRTCIYPDKIAATNGWRD